MTRKLEVRWSPMREQVDNNIIAEWRDLRLWNLSPSIAFAIADVIQECEQASAVAS